MCESCDKGFTQNSTLLQHVKNGCTIAGKGRKTGFKQIEQIRYAIVDCFMSRLNFQIIIVCFIHRQGVVPSSAPTRGSPANAEVDELRKENATLKTSLKQKNETIIFLTLKVAELEKKLAKRNPLLNVQNTNPVQPRIPFSQKRAHSQTDNNTKYNKKSSTSNENSHQ